MTPNPQKLQPFGVLLAAETAVSPMALATADLRSLVLREHLVVLRGFEPFTNATALADFSRCFGALSEWPFGTVLELIKHPQPRDHIFDSSCVPLHWDGMYRQQIPELQVFQCVAAPPPQAGGQTVFSHTGLALEQADSKVRESWQAATGRYRRKMAYYDSCLVSPVVTQHPYTGQPVLRYAEPQDTLAQQLINPADHQFTGINPDHEAAWHHSLQQNLRSDGCLYQHTWQTGDIVLADNFTLLHGRESYVADAPRHLRRVQVLSDPPVTNTGLKEYP